MVLVYTHSVILVIQAVWLVSYLGLWRYAPIKVNPVGGGGEYGQRVEIWQFLKFFDQIPQGGKRKVNQKCQKSPNSGGKI